jgi:hypothetical protein
MRSDETSSTSTNVRQLPTSESQSVLNRSLSITNARVVPLFDQNLFNCDHHRGMELMFDPGREECQLISYKCNSYSEYLAGNCAECGPNNQSCHPLAYHPLPITKKQGNFHLLTGSESPFCGKNRVLCLAFKRSAFDSLVSLAKCTHTDS